MKTFKVMPKSLNFREMLNINIFIKKQKLALFINSKPQIILFNFAYILKSKNIIWIKFEDSLLLKCSYLWRMLYWKRSIFCYFIYDQCYFPWNDEINIALVFYIKCLYNFLRITARFWAFFRFYLTVICVRMFF